MLYLRDLKAFETPRRGQKRGALRMDRAKKAPQSLSIFSLKQESQYSFLPH